jgi:hypothetical protein
VRSDPVSVAPGYAGTASAFCAAGKTALGGGGRSDAAAELFASTPTINANGWEVTYLNNRTFTVTVRAYVVCARVSS